MRDKPLVMDPHDIYVNPYPIYRQLRQSGGIHFNPQLGPSGSWLISRYHDVAVSFKNSNFSAGRSHLLFDRLPGPVRGSLSKAEEVYRSWAVFSDPPAHASLRRIITLPFTEARLTQLAPAIEEKINLLLTQVANESTVDLVRFSAQVPMQVMCLVLGVPEQDCNQLGVWISGLREFLWENTGIPPAIAMTAQDMLLSLHGYFAQMIRKSRYEPGTGIALMVEAIRDAFPLDEREKMLTETLPSQCCALLVAGHQTTSDLLSNGIHAFLRHPEQLRLILEKPELAMNAAREAARYDTPVHADARIVTVKCEFLGSTLEPGQMVTNLIASANHDEEKFLEPEVFNIAREKPAKALTFGTSRHYCVGEGLSLLELTIVFRNLFRRFPCIRLLRQDIEYKRNLRLRGVVALPVILDGPQVGSASITQEGERVE